MAFLRSEKKKSGTYLRIVQSYRDSGKIRHKTLYSLGKLEDYSADSLQRIAKKLIELSGGDVEEMLGGKFVEQGRYNYGYALVIGRLWRVFDIPVLVRRLNSKSRIKFDWESVLKLMIGERMNEPCSKRRTSFNQAEYIGFSDEQIPLHQFYRTLDLLSARQELVKKHLFTQRRSLFSQVLDVVFYDVTTLYFDSQEESEEGLRQKGYSKDGKAHKTQIVLGLLVDKARNPISYQIYQGNTYEGATMIDALKKMQEQFTIDRVIVVADSAMIDKANRDFMVEHQIDYIIGDSIKKLGKEITGKLLDTEQHTVLSSAPENKFSYRDLEYKGRRIICTYSAKRARKDAYQRQVLLDKANKWLANPSKYKQVKKRGAGRFIEISDDGQPIALDLEQIKKDEKYDGFKAIATTTDLEVEQVIGKYADLFEVEHTFRALKSQLEIRPIFHWTDNRIKGHICMCFIAFTFINHLRNLTKLQYRDIVKALDQMQLSDVLDKNDNKRFYLRSKILQNQQIIIDNLGLVVPNDSVPQNAVNQYFMK